MGYLEGSGQGDEERAMRVAKMLRTGQVSINGGAFNVTAPFGGYKQSGLGRELGSTEWRSFSKSNQFSAR